MMKSVIIFYSYGGNTRSAAKFLQEALLRKGEAELIELQCLDETGSFFNQCRRAFRKVRGRIQEVQYDLSGYDLICIGTPVWAFAPAPALNSYLDRCSGTEGKEALLFSTYGSGTGNKACLDYMQGLLAKKGIKVFSRFSVQGLRAKDRDAVLAQIDKALPLSPNG